MDFVLGFGLAVAAAGGLLYWMCANEQGPQRPPSSDNWSASSTSSSYSRIQHAASSYGQVERPRSVQAASAYSDIVERKTGQSSDGFFQSAVPSPSNRAVPGADPIKKISNPAVSCCMKVSIGKVIKGGNNRKCAYRGCQKQSPYVCARCFTKPYCSKKHHQADWYNHAKDCDHYLLRLSKTIGFSVDKMHVRLKPKRGSDADPYVRDCNVSARFDCPRCYHWWNSNRSCVDIDVRSCDIKRIYRQQCDDCGENVEPQVSLDDLVERLLKLMRWLSDLRDNNNRLPVDSQVRSTPPHRHDLCEKCEFGKKPQAH